MRIRASLAVILFVFAGEFASAQKNAKNELGLLLGATLTPHLNSASVNGPLTIGTGTTFQMNYARQLMSSRSVGLYAEVPALAIPLQTVTVPSGVAPKNYDSFFITPAIRANFFPSARVSPWLSLGGGFSLFDESPERMDGTHNTGRGTSGGAAQSELASISARPLSSCSPLGCALRCGIFTPQNRTTTLIPAADFSTT